MGLFSFLSRKKKMHIMGDSHVNPLDQLKLDFPDWTFVMSNVQGATASGLQNPHSKTLAGPIFNEHLDKNVFEGEWVFIHLGEVDCGFLMWVKSERDGISIQDQLKATMKNYADLLDRVKRRTKNCVVLSVVPPTIKDGTIIGNVANLRGQIKANQKQRTELTHQMNAELKALCAERRFVFLDIETALIDPVTGIVSSEFMNPNPEDHHLHPEKLRQLIVTGLRKIL